MGAAQMMEPHARTLAPVTTRHSTLFTRDLQARFCEQLAICGNVRSAAKAVGVSRANVYRLKRACARFETMWHGALILARTQAEEVLADRAMNGVEEVVYYHGEEVATRRRYDARLLLAHLARLDRMAEDETAQEAAMFFDEGLDDLRDAGEAVGDRRADLSERDWDAMESDFADGFADCDGDGDADADGFAGGLAGDQASDRADGDSVMPGEGAVLAEAGLAVDAQDADGPQESGAKSGAESREEDREQEANPRAERKSGQQPSTDWRDYRIGSQAPETAIESGQDGGGYQAQENSP